MTARCQIVAHTESGPLHRIIRFNQRDIAVQARPGNEIDIDGQRLPIMRSAPAAGWFECLYLTATHPALQDHTCGDQVDLSLIQEQTFRHDAAALSPLLIGEGLGLAPILFLSLTLATEKPVVLLGSHDHFPFRPHPSRLLLPHLPGNVIATMPLLEERKIACRLAHSQGAPGCFEGDVVALATTWLTGCSEQQRNKAKLYACGEHPRLAETTRELAERFGLPLQYVELNR